MVVINTLHVAVPAYPDEALGGSGLTRSPFVAQTDSFRLSRNRHRKAMQWDVTLDCFGAQYVVQETKGLLFVFEHSFDLIPVAIPDNDFVFPEYSIL